MIGMRSLLLVMLLAAPALADDATANRDLVVEYTRLARDAAANGNCDVVRDLGEKVRTLDPDHYTAVYVADEVIAKCLPAPSPVPQGAPVAPPPNIAPPTVAPVVRDAEPPPPVVPVQYGRPATPPLDGGRIAGEVLLGGLIASVGVLGGALLGAAACADNSNGDDFGCIATILIGAYGGGILGFGTGVWAAGNYGEETGSFGAAVLGGVLGGALGLVVAFGVDNNDELAVAAVILGPMVGSIVGFNATRRWKHPQGVTAQRRRTSPVGSFVQIENGHPSLGMPMMVRGNRQGVPTTTFTLLGGSF